MVTGLVEGTQDHKETHTFFHQNDLIFGSSEMLGKIYRGLVKDHLYIVHTRYIYIYTSYTYII